MPYLLREGHPTTLLVACGPNVTVNTILGLPFIQGTQMVPDASDQVAELRALDTPPFALDFRRTMCTVPPISGPPDEGIAGRYASIINKVDKIVAMYSGPTNAGPDVPKPASILRSPKCNNSVADESIVSIRSAIDPKIDEDTDVSSLNDVYNSA